jgi:hypothetical protein
MQVTEVPDQTDRLIDDCITTQQPFDFVDLILTYGTAQCISLFVILWLFIDNKLKPKAVPLHATIVSR